MFIRGVTCATASISQCRSSGIYRTVIDKCRSRAPIVNRALIGGCRKLHRPGVVQRSVIRIQVNGIFVVIKD